MGEAVGYDVLEKRGGGILAKKGTVKNEDFFHGPFHMCMVILPNMQKNLN